MPSTSNVITSLLIPVALLGATTGVVAGCGSGVDNAKLNDVKAKAAALQGDAKKTQDKIKSIQADVQSGKISAAKGQKEMEDAANSITSKAKATASEGIDAVKNSSHLSSDAKKQLEQAQQQLK